MGKVHANCPGCGARYHVEGTLVGKNAHCKKCGASFVLTEAGASPPPDPNLSHGSTAAAGCAEVAVNKSTTGPFHAAVFRQIADLGHVTGNRRVEEWDDYNGVDIVVATHDEWVKRTEVRACACTELKRRG